jgi:hypothetical protein
VRLRAVVLGALFALLPATASAASTPDPQVLRGALAEAPSSDFVEADTTVKGEGPLDATAYAAILATDAAKQQQVINGLNAHQFVSGYGRLWVKRASETVLVEQILAFADRSNAISYEGASKLADTTSADYTGSIDSSALPDSYGVEQLTGGYHTVAIAFVKGNDLLIAGFVSSGDYMVADTQAQAKAVYSGAPDYTIQPSTSAAVNSVASDAGSIAGHVIFWLFIAGVVLLVVSVVIRSRRRPAAAAALPFNLSADGRYWWDGAGWQDSAAMAPPSAQRTPDGAYWWDGRSWRPVPRPVEVPR